MGDVWTPQLLFKAKWLVSDEIDAALHTASLLRSPLVGSLNIKFRDSYRVDGPELVLTGGDECSLTTVVGGVDAGFVEHTGECQSNTLGSRELFDFRHVSGARLVEVVQRAASEKGHSPEDVTMIYVSKRNGGHQVLVSFEGDATSAKNSWLGGLS